MSTTNTPEHIAKQGAEIYKEQYKSLYEPGHNGEYVAIEVESQQAFLAESLEASYQKAKEKFPQHLFYFVKIGSPGVFSVEHQSLSPHHGWLFS